MNENRFNNYKSKIGIDFIIDKQLTHYNLNDPHIKVNKNMTNLSTLTRMISSKRKEDWKKQKVKNKYSFSIIVIVFSIIVCRF